MNSPIQCIALDLDRTTLSSDGSLSPGNRAALLRAMQAGIQIVVASGRSLPALPQAVLEVPGIRYAITSNGAAVFDLQTGLYLRRCCLIPASVDALLHLAQTSRLIPEAIWDGTPYVPQTYYQDPVRYGFPPQAIPYLRRTRRPVSDIFAFAREHRQELDCIDLILTTDQDQDTVQRLVLDQVPDIYLTTSMPGLLEISHRDCGKHTGAGFLLEHLGLGPEQLAAFGDGDNDQDLLRFAGLGIAVANASEACLAAANWITRSNDEDGVAYGIDCILGLTERN